MTDHLPEKAEEGLSAIERALDRLPLGFLRDSRDGRILVSNHTARELFGTNIRNKHITDFLGRLGPATSSTSFGSYLRGDIKPLARVAVEAIQREHGPVEMLLWAMATNPSEPIDVVVADGLAELNGAIRRIAKQLILTGSLENTLQEITAQAMKLCRADRSYIKTIGMTSRPMAMDVTFWHTIAASIAGRAAVATMAAYLTKPPSHVRAGR